jgi:phosphatidylglycerophosphate synthase
MLTKQKPTIEKLIKPLAKPFAKVNPSLLTLLGSIPPLLFFVFVSNHHFLWGLLMLLGSAFDMLDGLVARTYGKVTAFGAFFDSTIDRFADFFIITAFGFAAIVRWELVILLLLFSFLTSYTRSRSETLAKDKKVSFAVGIMERTERLIGLFIALLFFMIIPTVQFFSLNLAEAVFAVLIILSAITVFQRIVYAYKNL